MEHPVVEKIVGLFNRHGGSQYGGEAVTQREHGLQCALLARRAGLDAPTVAAALLHDIGHLLHHLPEDAPEQGIDDHHEELGAAWLEKQLVPGAVEPVRLHVAAKRYLCAVETDYLDRLSPPSVKSLELQGGPMSTQEALEFESHPHFRAAVILRRFDEEAKVPGLTTPAIEDFVDELRASVKGDAR